MLGWSKLVHFHYPAYPARLLQIVLPIVSLSRRGKPIVEPTEWWRIGIRCRRRSAFGVVAAGVQLQKVLVPLSRGYGH